MGPQDTSRRNVPMGPHGATWGAYRTYSFLRVGATLTVCPGRAE